MQIATQQSQQNFLTDCSFRKHSPNTTELYSSWEHQNHSIRLQKYESQPTLPQLPYNSRTSDFDFTFTCFPMQTQLKELQNRFENIHNILINHSQEQSDLHQKRRGFKVMEIDRSNLTKDYSNKASIIGDIVSIVDRYSIEGRFESIYELLNTKFQQYYLQRHYGGLSSEYNNLSLQERLDDSQTLNNSQEQQKYTISEIQDQMVKEQTKIESKLSNNVDNQILAIHVQNIRIIQVDIPYVVYKPKEIVIQLEKCSQTLKPNQIDNQILQENIVFEQYKPFKQKNGENIQRDHQINKFSCNQVQVKEVSSIMMNSHYISQRYTQVELSYSEFQEEHGFKLPLDSFAQFQSLISNQSKSNKDKSSRPPTERDQIITPINEDTILITQRGISRSILEKYEQNQRQQNQENIELKQKISILQKQLTETEIKVKELEAKNNKLYYQLEEQIQQNEYYSIKLNEINVQMLEEKVQCQTHLNQSHQRKIEILTKQLQQKNAEIEIFRKRLTQVEQILSDNDETICRKDEEIQHLAKILEERQLQLEQLGDCQEQVMKIASDAELNLKQQIQKLETEKNELKETIKQYQKRLQSEGISFQFEEASEIQDIIQNKEHSFSLELQQVNKKYNEIILLYQGQLDQLKKQLEKIHSITSKKNQLIASNEKRQMINKIKSENYCKQFEAIIQQYDRQLQAKDDQIILMKKDYDLRYNGQHQKLNYQRFTKIIQLLQSELVRQRQERLKVTQKFYQLQIIVQKQLEVNKLKNQDQCQLTLIQQLSEQLEKRVGQNSKLRQKIQEQSLTISNLMHNRQNNKHMASLQLENDKLRSTNNKLKRYSSELQAEIKAVCSIDECQSHKKWLNNLIEQKDYYLTLLENQRIQTSKQQMVDIILS